ncbi:Carboxypeptidase S1 [Colletotrichum higginsianum IMI 349063]|uniref:Carboxypeptidase S1 n=2 Tax=Colletotrichum higginsianum (strain IMI 349063) TaxID=759273 RepID=A0A1B7YGQ8_COLHI|nr:Carboxypeptidase S1 [Colletotrichum higginsianum IMI 349063]OBR11257.1 Carboxypeptidase S1 [Colletotrichum higginsianum IMI 349063]
MRASFSYLAAAFLAPFISGQFVAQPADLKTVKGPAGVTVRFKQVPNGICETNDKVKSFAGYVDVSPTQHMYFYLFEARQNAAAAPMTVRLDGGPGASSMNGLFGEIGPCTINAKGKVADNPLSWSGVSNLLFVDQPATVGFSYTTLVNGTVNPKTAEIIPQQCTLADPRCGTYSSMDISLTPNSTTEAAKVFYQVMQGIMGAFPQYTSNGVHITGQSYGGHYAPIFASYITEQNQLKAPGTLQIPLKSISIEDGFMDTRVQFGAYYNYSVSPGNPYDIKPFNDTLQQQLFTNMFGPGGCQDRQTACNSKPADKICADADAFCVDKVEDFWDINARRAENDIRYLLPYPFPAPFFVAYLNRADIQAAIGASNNFTQASVQTSMAFSSTGDDSRTGELVTKSMASLLQQGITVALFTGDADYDSNMIGAQIVAANVGAANWASAGFVNLTANSDGQIPGEVKQADAFSFTRLFFAGHLSAFNQPEAALRIQERVIKGVDIATGMTPMAFGKNLITKGPSESTFKEGPATVQTQVVPRGATYDPHTHLPVLPKLAAEQELEIHPLVGLTAKNIRKMLREDSSATYLDAVAKLK